MMGSYGAELVRQATKRARTKAPQRTFGEGDVFDLGGRLSMLSQVGPAIFALVNLDGNRQTDPIKVSSAPAVSLDTVKALAGSRSHNLAYRGRFNERTGALVPETGAPPKRKAAARPVRERSC